MFFVNRPRDTDETISLLLDDARGIYIPQAFYNHFDFLSWGLKSDDYMELSDPNNENYWEVWDTLLREAEYHEAPKQGEAIGHVWHLEQDGSLFAIRDDHESDEID